MKTYIFTFILTVYHALASLAKKGQCGSFFGFAKNEPPLFLSLCEQKARG
ncbi:MAG: hypothetical protein U5L45_04385 [Saprospiraceae bacterium]|nr:hypothetical protein [Saprospiraceae bacterium]